MYLKNQKWSQFSIFGQTQFKQAMLCNQFTKNVDSVYVCVYVFF